MVNNLLDEESDSVKNEIERDNDKSDPQSSTSTNHTKQVVAFPSPTQEAITSSSSDKTVRNETEATAQGEAPFVFDSMYDRMLKMKLPETAIRKKMAADGVPAQFIDTFFQENSGYN